MILYHNKLMEFYSRSMDSLVGKDREIVSLKRQLDATVDELTESSRGREVALRENRRLQDDLATITRENQVSKAVSHFHQK